MSNNNDKTINKPKTHSKIQGRKSTDKTPDKFVISSAPKSQDLKSNKGIQKKTNVIKSRKMTVSSKSWLLRQMNDPFVAKAKELGYRSRACFKLIEIDEKYKIIKNAKTILDLGCAPGSWIEVCQKLNPQAKITACDLLEMRSIPRVCFIQGDFTTQQIQDEICKNCNMFDVIISDIAPNTTGNFDIDHIRIMAICDEIIVFSQNFLQTSGNLVMKVFMGSEEKKLINLLRQNFQKVSYFKPKSSRSDSKEIYLVCIGKKLNSNSPSCLPAV